MRLSHILLVLIVVGALSACVTNLPTNQQDSTHNKPNKTQSEMIVVEKHVSADDNTSFDFSPYAHAKTAELLYYIDNFTQSTPEWQKDELNRLAEAIQQTPSDWRLQIKQAAILALPNSMVRDTKTAKKLLATLLANEQLNPSDQHLVKLISTFNNTLDIQAEDASEIAKKYQIMSKKNKALEQKLNDIKNIEKTMIERNAKTTPN